MVRPRSAPWQEAALLSAGAAEDATASEGETSAAAPAVATPPTDAPPAPTPQPATPAGATPSATAVASAAASATASSAAPRVAGWVEPEWWSQVASPAVREVMGLAPGMALMAALMALPAGACAADHSAEADVAYGEVLRWLAADGPVETIASAGALPDGTQVLMPAPGSGPGLPCACQVVIAAGWAACAAWVGGRAAEAVIAVAGPGPLLLHSDVCPDRLDPASDELAAVLHVSPRSAVSQIGAARRRAACAAVAATVDAGLLGAAGGAAIFGVLDHVPSDTAEMVSRTLAARIHDRRAHGLRGWTPAEARRAARAALLAVAPVQAEAARAAARDRRRVELRPVGDGTSWLCALLPELDALRIDRRLSALARAQASDAAPADRRLLDQRCADLLSEALLSLGTTPAGGTSTRDGHKGTETSSPAATDVQICVVATAETLLGLSKQPAHVPGIGAIPADLARELAADGAWRIWLRNAAGHLTAVDPARYRPTAGVARLIAAREPTCRFPGCLVKVERCDLDHTRAWPAAPGSTPENLGPLCRRHHNAKTHHSVALAALTTGGGKEPVMLEIWTWRMPSGLTHTIRTLTPLDDDLGNPPQRRRRRTRPKTRRSRRTRKNNRTRNPISPISSRRLRS